MTAPVNYSPSKPTGQFGPPKGSQAARRFTDTLWDQHKHPVKFPRGRPFCGQRELAATPDTGAQPGFITSDLQCGEFIYSSVNPETGFRLQSNQDRLDSLATAWSAPWVPLAKYFKFNYHMSRITLEYQRMENDELQGLDNYYEAAAKMAGDNDNIEYGNVKSVPYRIRAVIGMPTTMHRIAQAARAGDPWLLGFVTTPNEELAKCLNKNIRWLGRPEKFSDREYVITDNAPIPEPVVKPEAVLAASPTDLAKMIADAIEKHEAQKKAEHAAKSAAGKAKAKANKDAA